MESAIAIGLFALSMAVHVVMMFAAAVASWKGRRRRRSLEGARASAAAAPSVSILKPLAGEDDDLYANLASFTRLRHPNHQLLLGVASLGDPAAPVARRLIAAHPELDIRLVVTDAAAATNPKVAQLIGLAAVASGAVLVISDSNVRVPADYLEHLVQEFDSTEVGLVTNLFVGTGEASFGAALENLHITSHVAPAVAATGWLTSCPLTIGKSMALSRDALTAIGGFGAAGDVLAEDHLLGRLVRESGRRVALSVAPVENRNTLCDTSRSLERHTRWAKMRRAIAPVPFFLEPLADPFLIAAGLALLLPSRLTLFMVASALVWKMTSSTLVMWALRGGVLPLRYLPLELVRSALTLVCWARACASRRIVWRGHPFLLTRDSRISPAPPRFRKARPARGSA